MHLNASLASGAHVQAASHCRQEGAASCCCCCAATAVQTTDASASLRDSSCKSCSSMCRVKLCCMHGLADAFGRRTSCRPRLVHICTGRPTAVHQPMQGTKHADIAVQRATHGVQPGACLLQKNFEQSVDDLLLLLIEAGLPPADASSDSTKVSKSAARGPSPMLGQCGCH